MSFEITITGATAVEQAVLELARVVPERIMSALWIEAELTMTEAKRLCPVMDGALRASGQGGEPRELPLPPPEINAHEISQSMGFGGPAVKYALSVHENPRAGKTGGWGPEGPREIAFRWINGRIVPIGAQRKKWAKVGQWKYLEQPFMARAAGLAERIKARVLKAAT